MDNIEKLHQEWRDLEIVRAEKEKDWAYFATDKAQIDFARYCKEQLFIHGVNYCKPTYSEKNKLPDDIKYSYHKGVELYQTIMHYENGIIGPEEFIAKVREVEKAYCS